MFPLVLVALLPCIRRQLAVENKALARPYVARDTKVYSDPVLASAASCLEVASRGMWRVAPLARDDDEKTVHRHLFDKDGRSTTCTPRVQASSRVRTAELA